MRKSLVIVFALTVAGCSCSDDGKKPAQPTGKQQAPIAGAPAGEQKQQPAEQPKEPTELELRQQRIERGLTDAGLKPQYSETLPTQLGDLDVCKPIERRRYVINENDEIYEGVAEVLGADAFVTGPVNSLRLLTAIDDVLEVNDSQGRDTPIAPAGDF